MNNPENDLPHIISVRAYHYSSELRLMPDALLEAIKPLPITAGLAIPEAECVIVVKPLRAWLKLCDFTDHLSITIMHECIGIKNGNSYAQFKSSWYYYKPGTLRPKRITGLIRLDFIQ